MAGLSSVIVAIVFMILIFDINGEKNVRNKRRFIPGLLNNNTYAWICQTSPMASQYSFCRTTKFSTIVSNTTSITPSDDTDDTSSDMITTTTEDLIHDLTSSATSSTVQSSSTSSPTQLESAHWCRFTNGSYIPYGYSFMQTPCTVCLCTQLREIRCANIQCMTTYCVDSSTPIRQNGQCCTQCSYDTESTSCIYNNFTIPHGTIVKNSGNNVQCWCQLGTIECRQIALSSSSTSYWGQNTTTYIIIIIICICVILFSLLCCGCLTIYLYHQNKQHTMQQAHQEYHNNIGWQSMNDDAYIIDQTVQEKQIEAEQNPSEQIQYPTGYSQEYIPPPYAIHNGSYTSEHNEKNI